MSKQASGNLLKKAVAEAHLSVNKPVLSSSLKYDPTSPPSPIRSHSYEEKQQQKELLLQQHRELQKQFLQMKQAGVESKEVVEEEDAEGTDKEMEEESTELDQNVQSEEEKRESKEVKEDNREQVDAQVPEVCYLTLLPLLSIFKFSLLASLHFLFHQLGEFDYGMTI